MNSVGGTIDGTTTSFAFTIKAINANDVSPSFMIRKTLNDDPAGNGHGWDPNSGVTAFSITDDDVTGPLDGIFVDICAS